MNTLPLPGCAPVPLAHYLKALGVLRLVSEQCPDSGAMGHWQGNTFVLTSSLDRNALLQFFLEEYQPTPIIVPWSGSDFFKVDRAVGPAKFFKNQKTALTGEKAIEAILATNSDRLRRYRDALGLTFAAMDASGVKSKKDIEGSGKSERESKSRLLQALRNSMPEDCLLWIDAACVIETDSPSLNTLLGSGGGSDGNSHFSDNFMQSLWFVLADFDEQRAKPASSASGQEFSSMSALNESLFGISDTRTKIANLSPVMFDSGRVGGPNSTSGFIAPSASNPWDFVLMLEGACLFSGSLGKKMGSKTESFARFPFLLDSTPVGGGSPAFNERGRELWLPLWPKSTSLSELTVLYAEARLEKNGQIATSGLDAAIALAQYGCDRGITQFQRIGMLRGRVGGDNYFTTVNQGRFDVHDDPKASLLRPINDWLHRFRRAARAEGAPSSVQRAAHNLEASIMAFCKASDPLRVQELLISLGECEKALASSWKWTTKKEVAISPLPLLGPEWLEAANTGTTEFWLAASLASTTANYKGHWLPLRCHLEPVAQKNGREGGRFLWTEKIEANVVWREGDFAEALNDILARRIVLAVQNGCKSYSDTARIPARPSDIALFIEHRTDDALISSLLWGLSLIDFSAEELPMPGVPAVFCEPPAFYALLKLCFSKKLGETEISLVPAIHRRARAGYGFEASKLASRRLRASGLTPAVEQLPASGALAQRSAAALLFDPGKYDLFHLAERVLRPKQSNRKSTNITTAIENL